MAWTRKLLAPLLFLVLGAVVWGVESGPVPSWTLLPAITACFILLGPALVYANVVRPLESAPYVVLPDSAETTKGSDDWARTVVGRLVLHGFVARARYCLPAPTAFDFARRLDNSATGEVAVIMAGWMSARDTPIRLVVFYTCFRDGGELVTTNSPLAKMTPDLPGQVTYRLTEVIDPDALYAAHKRLVRRAGRKPKPIVLTDDPLAWERELDRREIATTIALGLGTRDDKAGLLRPTLKGALHSSLLFHPWLMPFHDWRATRAAAAALRSAPA